MCITRSGWARSTDKIGVGAHFQSSFATLVTCQSHPPPSPDRPTQPGFVTIKIFSKPQLLIRTGDTRNRGKPSLYILQFVILTSDEETGVGRLYIK